MIDKAQFNGDLRRRADLLMKAVGVVLLSSVLILLGCADLKRPKAEPFYAQTEPPRKQEFRWSNGKSIKSFDPARAAAAPETDVVHALYEGLTDIDGNTLKEIPGVAERWSSSPDLKKWTFHIREDALWTNGEKVTAHDFVSSWKRLVALGDRSANRYLFRNIVGMERPTAEVENDEGEPADFLRTGINSNEPPVKPDETGSRAPLVAQLSPKLTPPANKPEPSADTLKKIPSDAQKFGVAAIDELTLQVSLVLPDRDFPLLVSNPIFAPIYGNGRSFEKDPLSAEIVTNGAFRIADVGPQAITLDRSELYWNRKSVGLEKVVFVPMRSAEDALAAYRSGNIDAVTNANFEPLVIKLLAPYDDFRKTTFSALNYYQFNSDIAPYTDRRVREALTISIDRERLVQSELEGTAVPANSFLPLVETKQTRISFDVERARGLLETAGFPNGENFRQIRLVVNRNNTQQRVARSVAKMWKQNLNLDTEIIVKESAELEDVRNSGDYDLLRRGAVMPTADELVSLTSVFGISGKLIEANAEKKPGFATKVPTPSPLTGKQSAPASPFEIQDDLPMMDIEPLTRPNISEDKAVFSLYAIPLYFPTSYSLVKPYVHGFVMNGLDIPSLKEVSIDNSWQPGLALGES